MTLANLPNIHLIIMAIGMLIVLYGILRLAHHGNDVEAKQTSNEPELSDVFHYFLQEEEKKNNDMRAMLLRSTENKANTESEKVIQYKAQMTPNQVTQNRQAQVRQAQPILMKPVRNEIKPEVQNKEYMAIIERYQRGESVEHIARILGKGVGEVKLVLSLYAAQVQ